MTNCQRTILDTALVLLVAVSMICLLAYFLSPTLALGEDRRCCDECPATPPMAPNMIAIAMNEVDRMCCLVFNREWRSGIWTMDDYNCDGMINVMEIVLYCDVAFRGAGFETWHCE